MNSLVNKKVSLQLGLLSWILTNYIREDIGNEKSWNYKMSAN